MNSLPNILILTPVKNAEAFLDSYFQQLYELTYPAKQISIGFLESDSNDNTFAVLEKKLPELNDRSRRARLWKKDFAYCIPDGVPRHTDEIQVSRRITLAKSRNHLLFRAIEDEDWVLWLDADVIEYPADIIQHLLATGKEIVHPNCVLEYGGGSFDLNAWRDQGKLHLDDLRQTGDLVELDSVGGTLLLIKADVHRDGLIFPPFPYGLENPKIRKDIPWRGEIETEGLGIMADDMKVKCWGMPRLEIKHWDG
ncbi:MAG: hypothetical protein GY774_31785 [Planctomycetes bacterium]|nr:hypothetical protein [Planctomycetota bacterium]